MPTEKENEDIFGVTPGSIQSYALIYIPWELEDSLNKEIHNKGGDYLSMQDGDNGFGNGFILNVPLEDIINLAPRYNIDVFIFGSNDATSTPYLYKKDEKESFIKEPIETITCIIDLEEIAPAHSDKWEDLIFNDFFLESLHSRYGFFDEDE